MKKKLFVILMSIMMVITMMPAMALTAFADSAGEGTEGNPYLVSTEADLKAALEKGGYIKLSADIECAAPTSNTVFTVSKDVTIDINGKTLSSNGVYDGWKSVKLFSVSSGATLTVIGTGHITINTDDYGCAFYNNGGTIAIHPTDNTLYVETGSAPISGNTGTFDVRGGSYNYQLYSPQIESNNYQCVKEGDWYVVKKLPSICTVNGAEYCTIAAALTAAKVGGVITHPIILTDNASYNSAISEDYEFQGSGYTLSLTSNVRGGIYKCDVYANNYYGIEGGKFDGNITLGSGKTITGGEFKNDPAGMLGSDYGTVLKGDYYFVAKTANITEGEITRGLYYNNPSNYVASGYMVVSRDNTTSAKYFVTPVSNVNNGKIFKGVYYGDTPTGFLADGYKTGTVKDSGSTTCYIVGKNVSVSNYKVIGGTFAEDPSAFVDTNTFDVTENESEWTVTLKPGYGAAKISDTEYATVANAITAASNGDTIVLQKDIIDEQITFSSAKQLTFDLQNHHVANSKGCGMSVSGGSYGNGCVITIKGGAESYISGSTSAVETSSSYAQLVFGEEFLGKVETTIKKTYGTITIKSGLYKTGVSIDSFLDITRGTDTTSVEGYTKVVPLTANDADCAVITAGGEETYYRLTSNNSLDISNAWSAADGNTLKLLKDTPTIGHFKADPGSGKSLVLDLNGKKITNNSTYAVYLKSGTLTVQGNGTIDASGTGASYGIQACDGTTLNITNGTIIGKYNAINTDSSSTTATINVNGGTFTKGISAGGSSIININGGSFSGNTGPSGNATMNVYGGTVETAYGGNATGTINIHGGSVGNVLNYGTTNVSGGYVKDAFYTNPSYQGIKFNLTGGEYGFDPSSYISDTEHYSAEVVMEGVRWKVVQKGVTKPEIVQYLEGESTETFTLTENIDISDYAYSFTSIGTKTINLNGHTLTVKHDVFNVGGTLNITNTGDSQGAIIEPVEILEGYNRGIGSTITVNSSGDLAIDGNIRVYGNANAVSLMADSELNITGAEIEANYNAAIAMFNGAEATIKDATIVSHSSSTLNGHTVWSYAIRADAVDGKLTIDNSTVTGVQGAIGISQSGFVAEITNCTLTAKHTAGKTDCHAALYVATNATANVYNTKMYSDRANYAAFSGNNDITEDYGIINLYDGCLLSDKYYKQSTKAYGDPAENCEYIEASAEEKEQGYDWKVKATKIYVAQIGTGDDATKYETLAEAVAEVKTGETIKLLADIENIGNVSIPAGVALDGDNHKIAGASGINIDAAGGTVKNVKFENIHNAKVFTDQDAEDYKSYNLPAGTVGKQSAIYAHDLTGCVTITGCEFDTVDWDAIQITPKEDSSIIITDNLFKHTNENAHQLRYIHIQNTATALPANVSLTIQGNRFYNTKDTSAKAITTVGVWKVEVLNKNVTLTGNYFEYEGDIVYTNAEVKRDASGNYYCDKLFPAIGNDGKDLIPVQVVVNVAYLTNEAAYGVKFNNTYKYFTLADLIKAEKTTAILLRDIREDVTVPAGQNLQIQHGKFKLEGTIINNGTLELYTNSKNAPVSTATITNNGTVKMNCDAATGYTVNGGRVEITKGGTYDLSKIKADSVVISGGTFTTKPADDQLKDFYIAEKNSNDTYTVRMMTEEEAKAAGAIAYGTSTSGTAATNYYKTLENIAEYKVVLMKDAIGYELSSVNYVYLYTNGYKFSGSINTPGHYTRIDKSNVIVTDVTGKELEIGAYNEEASATVKNAHDLQLLDVSAKGTCTVEGGKFDAVSVQWRYENGEPFNKGNLTVTGGLFKSDMVTISKSGTATVKPDPVKLKTYVPEGYKVVELKEGDEGYAEDYRYKVIPASVAPTVDEQAEQESQEQTVVPKDAEEGLAEKVVEEVIKEITGNTSVSGDEATNIQSKDVEKSLKEVIEKMVESTSQLKITVKSVATTTEETTISAIKAEKVTTTNAKYDVKPWVTVETTVGDVTTTQTRVITNEELAAAEVTIRFRLAIPESMKSGTVLVKHYKEDGVTLDWAKTYAVNGEGSNRYVELEANSFSIYEVEDFEVQGYVALNTNTNTPYSVLTTALSEAEAGETVILLKDLVDTEKVNLVEVAPEVTLDLNGHDLEARIVVAFGLVKNNRGAADGKLIVAQNNFAYMGGKEMNASDENVMPVWDTNGYVFYAVNKIDELWAQVFETDKNPKYWFRPESEKIGSIFATNSGVKLCLELEYKEIGSNDYEKMTVEIGQQYIQSFLNDYDSPMQYGVAVALLGTGNIGEIKATAYLLAEKCNFRVSGVENTITRLEEEWYNE